ncbi:hypothetical protein ACHAW6_003635 [Cyclotella cf. meneghiniana]
MGQFLGFSQEHSSLVALVQNLHTSYVSLQYHVVFDDKFDTVFNNSRSSEELDKICAKLFVSSRECFAEDESMRMVFWFINHHTLMKHGCLSLSDGNDANFWKNSMIVLLGNRLLSPVKSRSISGIPRSLYQCWRSPTSTVMMKILCLVVQTLNLEEI